MRLRRVTLQGAQALSVLKRPAAAATYAAASTPISPHVPSGTAFRIPGRSRTANSATKPPPPGA